MFHVSPIILICIQNINLFALWNLHLLREWFQEHAESIPIIHPCFSPACVQPRCIDRDFDRFALAVIKEFSSQLQFRIIYICFQLKFIVSLIMFQC